MENIEVSKNNFISIHHGIESRATQRQVDVDETGTTDIEKSEISLAEV